MKQRTLSAAPVWLGQVQPQPAAQPDAGEVDRLGSVKWFWRLTAVLLCGLHAYAARHTMNPDGFSYLDLADAWRRGAWGEAVNAYWSPLYSWLIAAVLAVFRPTPFWECAVV